MISEILDSGQQLHMNSNNYILPNTSCSKYSIIYAQILTFPHLFLTNISLDDYGTKEQIWEEIKRRIGEIGGYSPAQINNRSIQHSQKSAILTSVEL